MSFNANTLYRGVDVEEIARECREAVRDAKIRERLELDDWFFNWTGIVRDE